MTHAVSRAAVALSLGLAVAAAPLASVHAAPPAEDAESLFFEGSARYSAADYDGAIEMFTKSLTLVTKNGGDYFVRAALLLNLAKAHISAYEEIDQDIARVKQARSVYKRYLTEAELAQEAYTDVELATRELARLEQIIEDYEADQAAKEAAAVPAGPAPQPMPPQDTGRSDEETKARTMGVGFLVSGIALTIGGGIAIGFGSTFKRFAEEDILNQNDPGHSFTPAEQAHIDDEQAKGRIWMGVGGVGAALGLAGIGVGAWQLSKAKKLRGEMSWRLTPTGGRGYAGLSLSGSF